MSRMRASWFVALVALGVACSGTTAPKPQLGSAGNAGSAGRRVGMKEMTVDEGPGPTFVRGPALSPADKLLAWLGAQQADGEPKLVRLPVVMPLGETRFSTGTARIGGSDDAPRARLDDTMLGVGLADHAYGYCKGQPQCAFWVHAYFRGIEDGVVQLEIEKMERFIPAGAIDAASYAEVEGDSPRGN